METKDLPREKIILIDNELSTIQNVEDERLRRFKEFCKIICYIAAIISIVLLVLLMIDVKKVFYRSYDTEASVSDGLVGPTIACILGRQFRNLMVADRFFFTHSAGGHQHEQGLPAHIRAMVRQRKLADILCDNLEIQSVR